MYNNENGPALVATAQSQLDNIVERILKASRDAQEIGHKLNEHADRLHGPVPCGKGETVRGEDRPQGVMERINLALNDLDQAQSYMAEAAGRNTTIA